VVPGTSLLPVPLAILVLLAATLTLDAYASAGVFAPPPWVSVGNFDDARNPRRDPGYSELDACADFLGNHPIAAAAPVVDTYQ
jgi:hypothetical protein